MKTENKTLVKLRIFSAKRVLATQAKSHTIAYLRTKDDFVLLKLH